MSENSLPLRKLYLTLKMRIMIQLYYISTKEIPLIVLSALTKPNENTASLIMAITPLLLEGFSGNWDDLCGFEGYKILIHLREAKVNKEYVKYICGERAVDELAKNGHGEFPYHASICCRGKDEQLYFCISYEPCCPNWNKEQRLIKAVPLSEIDMPIIDDVNGIKYIDKTVLEYIQFNNRPKVNFPDYGKQPTSKQLAELINLGMPCYYRHGWAYRGASEHEITKEEALELLPHYSYDIGFYILNFKEKYGVPTLEFNELGENDLY